jgi:hypothetical protein
MGSELDRLSVRRGYEDWKHKPYILQFEDAASHLKRWLGRMRCVGFCLDGL